MPDAQFEIQLDSFLQEVYAEASAFAPQIAEQLLSDILNSGPYWSGRSKASWVLSLNEPVTQEAVDVPKRAGGIPEEEAKQRSLATVSNLAGFRLGETIFLSQGTLYLGLIESGAHPGSNDVGFVAAAVSKFLGLVNLEVSL